MTRIVFYIILTVVFFMPSRSHAQYQKDGYRFEQKIKAPRVRRPIAHEIMLDPMERFLIVSYSSHPTVVVLYNIPSWEKRGTYNIPEWFDLGNSFMGPNGRYLYLDFARFSSQYRRVDIETSHIDTVECFETPRGCVPKEGAQQIKSLYTNDKRYYFTVNKKNKRDILVFEKIVE